MFKKYLFLIIAVVIASSIFIVSKFINNNKYIEPLVLEKQGVEETDDGKLVGESDKTKDTALKPQTRASDKLPLPPLLGQPINIITSLSDSEKDEIMEQIKYFEASLKNKPENMHEWIQLGNLRKFIGDYFGAIDYWKYASILEPSYHVPYNNLANLYHYYLNDFPKAEEYYKKFIELSSQMEEPYKLLFDLYTLSYTQKENLALGVLEDGIKNATHNDYLKRLLENYKKEKGIE